MSFRKLRKPGEEEETSEEEDEYYVDESQKKIKSFPIPIDFDFDLVVGQGDNKKTIKTNKAVVSCFFPGLKDLVGDLTKTDSFDLLDLNPEAVELVLKANTTRFHVDMPSRWQNKELYESVQNVLQKFGLIEQPKKKAKATIEVDATKNDEHIAMTDNSLLDATFLVGPEKEEVKVNRAALASVNEVLARILYGTGSISVDPTKAIEGPQFEKVEGVRKVFLALLQLGKQEVTIPLDSVETAKSLVGYLMETS